MSNRRVLIVGAGITGITTALELARSGVSVYLIDREPGIGGRALNFCCKATDRCNQCFACIVTQRIGEVRDTPTITLYTDAQVGNVDGQPGNFSVQITQSPELISATKCVACGRCAEVCPAGCVRLFHPQSYPLRYFLDKTACIHFQGKKCGLCAEVCPAGAIDLEAQPREIELKVEALVAATGFDPYPAGEKAHFAWKRLPGVVTGAELERMIRERGEVVNPATGELPKKIAFVQCVGSRDEYIGHGYCSRVCCSYALRMAHLIKYDRKDDVDIAIFYMDIQNFGKEFDAFFAKCRDEDKIRFVRGIPAKILKENGRLNLQYEDMSQSKVVWEQFDMAVLSVGIAPRSDARDTAQLLHIESDERGFFSSANGTPNSTRTAGVYAAGTCRAPMDISDCITAGQAAAAEIVGAKHASPKG